jgi:hypothetical protein
MPATVYYGTVTSGKLKAALFVEAIRAIEGPVRLTVERDKPKRSSPQNRYYHGVVLHLIWQGIRAMGSEVTKAEVHEFLKMRFSPVEIVNEATAEVITLPGSTTKMDTVEFAEFLDKCIAFAGEFLNVRIPPAGEQVELEMR